MGGMGYKGKIGEPYFYVDETNTCFFNDGMKRKKLTMKTTAAQIPLKEILQVYDIMDRIFKKRSEENPPGDTVKKYECGTPEGMYKAMGGEAGSSHK